MTIRIEQVRFGSADSAAEGDLANYQIFCEALTEGNQMNNNGLSLFGIESALHELMDAWQDARSPEDLIAAENAIRAYAEAEVRKVDGVRAYLKFCDDMAAAAKAEAQVQRQRADMWQARGARLKETVQNIMAIFGVRKLEGKTGSVRIQGNGGKRALTITDQTLIADEFCVYAGEIDAPAWTVITQALIKAGVMPSLIPHVRMVRTVNNSAVSNALEAKCDQCHGAGSVKQGDGETVCVWCSGGGTRLVPGARLEPRGESLRVS